MMRPPWTAFILIYCWTISSILAKEDALEGDVIWSFSAGGNVMASAVLDNRHVYFGTLSESATEPESVLHCVDQTRGEEV